jgi:hypothetical protein
MPREGVAGISAAGTFKDFAASRHKSSRLTLSTVALISKSAGKYPQRISSVRNQLSWL